jgi:hypothetical protein
MQEAIAKEQWVAETSRAREDPDERRILQGYATWLHLRKLRQRLRGNPATYLQALNVRCHVTAAARYLGWLAGEGLTLASCRQGDVERWACSAEASYRDETAHFIRWAVEHRHARGLTAGAVRRGGPQGPHDTCPSLSTAWSANEPRRTAATLPSGAQAPPRGCSPAGALASTLAMTASAPA